MARFILACLLLLPAVRGAEESDVAAPRWEAIDTIGRALQDTRGHIWCLRTDRHFVEWDGAQWRQHPAPPDEVIDACFDFVPDDRNRGWLLPATNKPLAICDFTTGKWQTFPSLHRALVAQLPKGVKFHIPSMPFLEYTFSDDGRIGAWSHNNSVDLYEKGRWRTWKFQDIAGRDTSLGGTPFFAPDGKLSVPVNESIVWQWHGTSNGWGRTNGVTVPHPGIGPDYESPRIPEEVEMTDLGDGVAAQDRHGAIWFLRHGASALLKFAVGREVRALDENESSPFHNDRSVYRALVDDSGNVLLDGGFSGEHPQVFIRSRLSAPRCDARLIGNKEDTAQIDLGRGEGVEAWHTWRIDGCPWQPLREVRALTLDGFLPGKHTVEVRAFNAELTPSASTVTLSFVTSPAAEARFAASLRDLANPDIDTREAAARKLKSQGPAALPRLCAARESVPADARWWIDAIIQHIERQPETQLK